MKKTVLLLCFLTLPALAKYAPELTNNTSDAGLTNHVYLLDPKALVSTCLRE
jgi:hypothetical protein